MRILSLLLYMSLGLAAQTCQIPDLPSGAVLEGKIELSDCTVREIASFSNDSSRADAWRLTVPADAVYTLRMTSSEMPVTLYLIRDRIPAAVADGEAGSTGAEVLIRLLPGSYTIIAAGGTEAATGAYKLAYSSEKPRACEPQEIKTDEEISGALESSDCRAADLFPLIADSSLIDIYRVHLEERRVLTITQQSPSIDSYLEVRRSDRRSLAGNDDYAQSLDSRVIISLEAGTYLIYAGSALGAETGAYRIKTRSETFRPCPVGTIEPGSELNVPLESSDCRWLDFFPFTTSEAPVKRFRMGVNRESAAVLDIASERVTPWVYLMDSRGRNIGSHRSRLLASVAPGDWTVIATRSGSAYGDVRLKWTQESLRDCPPADLELSTEATSTLAAGGCRVLDVIQPSSNASAAKLFRLSPATEQVLTIQAAAEKWKPSLSLMVGGVTFPGAAEGALSALLLPGEYRLLATHARETGGFQIRTSARDPRPCPARPLSAGETKDGALDSSSCALSEVFPLLTTAGNRKVSVYTLRIDQSGPVTLQVTSSGFPPAILIPFDQSWSTGIVDMNERLGQTATVRWNATPGTYKVMVFPLLPLTGPYRISVTPAEGTSLVVQ